MLVRLSLCTADIHPIIYRIRRQLSVQKTKTAREHTSIHLYSEHNADLPILLCLRRRHSMRGSLTKYNTNIYTCIYNLNCVQDMSVATSGIIVYIYIYILCSTVRVSDRVKWAKSHIMFASRSNLAAHISDISRCGQVPYHTILYRIVRKHSRRLENESDGQMMDEGWKHSSHHSHRTHTFV